MIDLDGTVIVEGVEITGEEFGLIEIIGYSDVEEKTVEEIESYIENHI